MDDDGERVTKKLCNLAGYFTFMMASMTEEIECPYD
eukprot:CAMPEP_0116879344 /NCGR_PEP_ID=MMETSP0463-20121206/11152_1 /TAXON_ID=181622 /ORGANISM="Strombidinopsis sp, Strain SopsisLIS2011" /LENGTH=35 /DNA_ID= /DNA_START= /DNA_END= /DNA_ORIENTATION=